MIKHTQPPVNTSSTPSLLNETPDEKTIVALTVFEEESIKQLKENVRLQGMYAQLPNHCIQLCFLS